MIAMELLLFGAVALGVIYWSVHRKNAVLPPQQLTDEQLVAAFSDVQDHADELSIKFLSSAGADSAGRQYPPAIQLVRARANALFAELCKRYRLSGDKAKALSPSLDESELYDHQDLAHLRRFMEGVRPAAFIQLVNRLLTEAERVTELAPASQIKHPQRSDRPSITPRAAGLYLLFRTADKAVAEIVNHEIRICPDTEERSPPQFEGLSDVELRACAVECGRLEEFDTVVRTFLVRAGDIYAPRNAHNIELQIMCGAWQAQTPITFLEGEFRERFVPAAVFLALDALSSWPMHDETQAKIYKMLKSAWPATGSPNVAGKFLVRPLPSVVRKSSGRHG